MRPLIPPSSSELLDQQIAAHRAAARAKLAGGAGPQAELAPAVSSADLLRQKIAADRAAARAKLAGAADQGTVPSSSSADLLRQKIAAERAAVRAKLAGAAISAEDLARLQAAAAAASEMPAEAMDAVGSAMPTSARLALAAASGVRVLTPKIWAENVKRFAGRRFPVGDWLKRAREVTAGRQRGDVLQPTLVRVCEVIAHLARDTGKTELTFVSIARLVGCCQETARKSVRWLEGVGLIDTFNALERVRGKLLRGANVYLPLLEAPDDAAAGDAAGPLSAVARLNARLNRWAGRFGLVARAWGLNATPLAAHHLRSENPVPS